MAGLCRHFSAWSRRNGRFVRLFRPSTYRDQCCPITPWLYRSDHNLWFTSKIKHAIKHKTSPARLAQLLQPSLAFCFSLQPMTAYRPVLRAAKVVQQLCKTCFKFYCMFYFTCDHSLTSNLSCAENNTTSLRTVQSALGDHLTMMLLGTIWASRHLCVQLLPWSHRTDTAYNNTLKSLLDAHAPLHRVRWSTCQSELWHDAECHTDDDIQMYDHCSIRCRQRCVLLISKRTKSIFGRGSTPDPAGGAYDAPLRPSSRMAPYLSTSTPSASRSRRLCRLEKCPEFLS